LITTITSPLQEREEQTLNQEVQLQQGYETINTLVLALKVVIEQSKAALPADSTASNPVSLALTIWTRSPTTFASRRTSKTVPMGADAHFKRTKVDEQAKTDGDANRMRKEMKRQKKSKEGSKSHKVEEDGASLKKCIESCERELEHAKHETRRRRRHSHEAVFFHRGNDAKPIRATGTSFVPLPVRKY
jgi:hypothetical protein